MRLAANPMGDHVRPETVVLVPALRRAETMNPQALADVRTLVEQGHSVNKATKTIGEQYGVAPSTIRHWAKQTGTSLGDVAHASAAIARARAREERAARIEQGLAAAARLLPEMIGRAETALQGRDADGFVRAARGLLEIVRLVEGESTERIEHMSTDAFMERVRALNVELESASPRPSA